MSKEFIEVEKTIRDLAAELEVTRIRFDYDGKQWQLTVTRSDKTVAVFGRTLLAAVTDVRIAYSRDPDAPPF